MTTRPRLVVLLGALTAFGPFTIDLYLPSLPRLARSLHTSVGAVQATLTACIIGLAVGQLVAGPLTDGVGRRRPLLVGLALFTVASLGCAAVDSVTALVALRALQGFSGAFGITIARAMVRDSFSGPDIARMYSSLAAVASIAPVAAPLIGGLLLLVGSWRSSFLFLAAVGLSLFLATLVWTAETLTVQLRHPGRHRSLVAPFTTLLRSRTYLMYLAPCAFSAVALFGFLSTSSFVYQNAFGFSAQLYAVLFGVNGVVLVATSVTNRALLKRSPQRSLLVFGLLWLATGGLGVAVAALAGSGPLAVVPLVWVACVGIGLVQPNAMSLALVDQQANAGAAVGLIGLSQFLGGAAVPLVVSAVGASPTTMGAIIACSGILAALTYRLFSERSYFAAG